MKGFFKSSIGRKFAMALSAMFLMFFLLQHFLINVTSIFPDHGNMFNQLSHFMGTNPLVQFGLQPVLMIGVVYHFVMGFILEIQNNKARGGSKYAKNNGAANSTWFSRNMIWSGGFILTFLIIHFIDFWIPEMNTKYIHGDMSGMHEGKLRYFHELQIKFKDLWRVALYIVGFVFLAMHLMHGFASAFQSVGVDAKSPKASNKYASVLQKFGKFYAIAVPTGFIIVTLFHYINSINH